MSISSPDPQAGVSLPEKGERLRIVGDVAEVNDDAQVQKALRRLTAEMAPTSVTQLVMWRLAGRLDWDTIAELSQKWANDYELTWPRTSWSISTRCRRVRRADCCSRWTAKTRRASRWRRVSKLLRGKTVLGLVAQVGEIPSRPEDRRLRAGFV